MLRWLSFREEKMQKKLKLLGLGILLAFLFWVFQNQQYLIKQGTYLIRKPKPQTENIERMTPDTLVVSSIGLTSPIVYVQENSEIKFQAGLENGVVHYPGTALPGDFGNVYIFGHSSDYLFSKGNYKTIFALLPKVKRGDNIKLSDNSGKIYNYIVIETRVVSPKDLSVLDQKNNERKLLTLQTSYPIGTALERYIVVAELK